MNLHKSPHHPLAEVKRLVAASSFSVSKTRALDFLIPPRTYTEAMQFVADAVQKLSGRNFFDTKPHEYDVADIYGLNVDGDGWYIKICIDRTVPEVVVISFHPPEHPLRTSAGLIKPP